MKVVLDCSFCVALFIPDPKSVLVLKSFSHFAEDDNLLVPHLWWYEISNVLAMVVRKNRMKRNTAENIMANFENFGMETDSAYGNAFTEKILSICHLYNLTAYDASYLELAIRKNAMLATLDGKLINAAKTAGVPIIG